LIGLVLKKNFAKLYKILAIFNHIPRDLFDMTERYYLCCLKFSFIESMKTPLVESLVGWATLGFFILWVMEFRRTQFQESYWLLMLSLSCLLGFQYLRYRRGAVPLLDKYDPKKEVKPKATVKPSLKKKK
jgi:hypothetical protein